MRTREARLQLTRTGNAWRPIPHSSINPVVNTAPAISSFAARTCPACVAAKRFDNSGSGRVKAMMKKQNEPGSSTFARSARVLKSQPTDESRHVDQTTRLLGLHVLSREGPLMATRPRPDRLLGDLFHAFSGNAVVKLLRQLNPVRIVIRGDQFFKVLSTQ